MSEPRWVTLARQDLGLAEIPGKQTATRITKWLVGMRAWWHDDETPWCGVAMDAWMRAADIAPPPAAYRARSWLNWGFPVTEPVVGAVAVLGHRRGDDPLCARGDVALDPADLARGEHRGHQSAQYLICKSTRLSRHNRMLCYLP